MALCKVCQVIDDALFYPSIKTYCKEHWKEKVRANRIGKIEYYRSFDRMRASKPHRVKARKEYSKTEQGRVAHCRANKGWYARHPERKAANSAVANALRDGNLQKLPCLMCGDENVEAHHPAYSMPLVVTWLCVKHHKELHWHMDKAA